MTTRLLTWTALALVIAVIGTAAWWLWPRPQPLDPQTAEALLQEANLAIAELENQKLTDAIPRLEAIAVALPADPFGPRNLAVATILAIGEGPVTAEQLTSAVAALERLAAIETPSRAFHWLSAKLALLAGDADAAAAAFAKVVESDPDDAAAWYGSWQAQQLRDESAGGSDGHADILQRACGADPRNLWLAVEWLRAAAIGLDRGALTADASLVQQVEDRWTAIAPFAPAVLAFTKTDVREMLDRGITALESGDAATASGTLRGLANLLVPQAAGDRTSVDPHPLEFVIERLTDATRSAAAAAGDAAAIPVQYLPRPLPLDSPASAVRLDDIDLDGRIDLVICDDSTLTVFTQQGTDWTPSLSAPLPVGCDGMLTVDLDLDFDEAKRQAEVAASGTAADDAAATTMRRCPAADLDLIAYGSGGLVCFENRLGADGSSRSLEPLPAPLPMVAGAVRAAAATDLDADGPIDLVLCDDDGLRLWLNHGSQGFVDATPAEAMPPREQPIVAIVPVDIDRDIDIDLLLCSDAGVGILENLRHGQFRYRPTSFEHPAESLDVLDADADGRWDAVVAGPDGLWLVPDVAGTSPQQKALPQLIDAAPCEHLITVDFDNDGWLDVITASPQRLQAWRGARAGFAAANVAPADTAGLRGLDTADIDGDGDLDLACAGGELLVLDNDGGNAHHWLAVDLEAQQIKGGDFAPSGRVNAHGLGSLLELKAGGLYQPQTVRRRTTHFGLGDRAGADAVRVLWLNGVPQNILQPQADLLICEQQILLGSCPYLYAWDGSGYRFVTDLLWAAPLGLQRSEGELMPDRPQEFISIPRGLLVEADGEYRMQITEELWEAAYFDEVKLLAIDHPAGVEVFSNEKVGPPDLADFRLHTVRQRTPLAAAKTGDGQDVLPLLAAEDGVFLPPSGRKLRQGLTEPSVLELDLGSVDDPSQLTLFLTGWTYPTTVSLNVALGRDPALGLPAPPSLSVPDGNGGWNTVLPMMGFPGGKTKTMAVDLSGLVPADDPRVRIETTMEIAWDTIFFTSGEEAVELVTHEVRPRSADLHHRGFSRIEQGADAGPERFDYDQVSTSPKWPPMQGAFTRFGDVRALLAAQDDRLVVMAAGDEITLRFTAPPLAQPGWERDFVLASFGWDKDANLATAVGDTSEPLPFAAMQHYPPAADDPPPDNDAYRAYLLEFQTRRQTPAFWQTLRREFNRLEVGLTRE